MSTRIPSSPSSHSRPISDPRDDSTDIPAVSPTPSRGRVIVTVRGDDLVNTLDPEFKPTLNGSFPNRRPHRRPSIP